MNKKYGDKFDKAVSLPLNFNNSIGRSLVKIAIEEDFPKKELYEIVPNYLRASQAERELAKNDKKDGNKGRR